MDRFVNYLQGSIIIGHYVDFDFKMLSEACKRNLGFALQNQSYDTMQLLKRTDNHFAEASLHKAEDLGLDSVCTRFNIPINDRHTAMGDAFATALLFARQLKKLEHRGVKTVKDLLRR
jgi:DNA polymerase-3 subunit epsilon